MLKISIISPIHNEEDVLEELAERVNKVMTKNYRKDWEYLLVDDASTDKTPKILMKIKKKYKNIKPIRKKIRDGQTGAFKTGFDNAKGSIVITMDGDLQVFPEDLPLFVEKIRKGYDVVNGIREHRQHSFVLRFASRVYNTLMLIFFNVPVIDAASNFSAFKAKFVKGLKLIDNDHRYIIPIVMKKGAKRIGEIVVRHTERKGGKSKYKTLIKFIKGGPEIILAWFRIKLGRYNL